MATQAQSVLELARSSLEGPGGFIRKVQQLLLFPGDPRIFLASAVTASLENISEVVVPGHQGAAGFSWEEAAAGAIGEAIERYCAACYEWNDLVYANQEKLGDQAVGMDRFSLYTSDIYDDARFPLVRWRSDKKGYWVRGKSLMTGKPAYIPAAMVYIPYRIRNKAESDFWAVAVSSGQACHTNPNKALFSGLCEVIERDAFMITWMRRIPPIRIDYKSDPEVSDIFLTHFDGSNLDFHVFDISLDIRIPTMLCLAWGETHRGPFVAVGAATHTSERKAILKSIKEAAQGANWARQLVLTRSDWRPTVDFSNLIIFEDHVRLYCEPEMGAQLNFIMQTSRSRPPAERFYAVETEAELEICLSEIARNGLEAYVVDLTTPEMAELGFYVPKVFVPGLAHLTAIHKMPALATPRYREVIEKLALGDPVHQEFNPVPHPFP